MLTDNENKLVRAVTDFFGELTKLAKKANQLLDEEIKKKQENVR